MANFNGTWKTDLSSVNPDQQSAMLDALGMSAAKEKMRGSITTMVCTVSGKEWTIKLNIDKFPSKTENTYKATAGEKLCSIAPDGSPFEVTIIPIDDNKMVEESRKQVTPDKWVEFKINREIKGNVMHIKSECNNVTFEHRMTKEQ